MRTRTLLGWLIMAGLAIFQLGWTDGLVFIGIFTVLLLAAAHEERGFV